MAQNLLTIGDVYKPLTAKEVLEATYMKERMDSDRVRNRLELMKMQEEADTRKGWSEYFTQPQTSPTAGGGGGLPGMPPAPGSGSGAGAMNMLAPGATSTPTSPTGTPLGPSAASSSLPPSSGMGMGAQPAGEGREGTATGPIGYKSPDLETDAGLVVQAMAQVESGDGQASKNVMQYEPDTWARYSTEYNQATFGKKGVLPMTPQNQKLVAKYKVKEWLAQGYSPQQIASIWNAGKPNWAGWKGTNKRTGVEYDTPNHVAKFTKAYGMLAEGYGMPSGAKPSTPTQPNTPATPGAPKTPGEGGGIASPDATKSAAYNMGRIQAAMVPFQEGLTKAMASNNQQTLTKYLDYVDGVAPFLKNLTTFYRGLELQPSGKLNGVIPKGMMTPQLYAEWLGKIPPELQSVVQGAMGPNGYAIEFKMDENKRITEVKPVKDVATSGGGRGAAPKSPRELAAWMVIDKKKEMGEENPTASGTEIHAQMIENRIDEKKKENEAGISLTQETIDRYANQFNRTGIFPPGMGWGTAAQLRRDKISNRATELAKEQGLDINLAEKSLQWKSDQANLPKVQNIYNMTKNFEETVKNNMPLLKQSFDNYKLFPVRKIADLENYVKNDLIGDPEARVLYNVLYETLVDYGKVLSGNFSIAGLTDSARIEAQKLLDAADTPEAREKILDSMGQLMENRINAIKAQSEEILGRYRDKGDAGAGGGGGKGTPTTTTKPKSKGKLTDQSTMDYYIKQAKGDVGKAVKLAEDDGWEVE